MKVYENLKRKDFDLVVRDVYELEGQGIALEGFVRRGIALPGDRVTIYGPDQARIPASLDGLVDLEGYLLESGREGQELRLILRELDFQDVYLGDLVTSREGQEILDNSLIEALLYEGEDNRELVNRLYHEIVMGASFLSPLGEGYPSISLIKTHSHGDHVHRSQENFMPAFTSREELEAWEEYGGQPVELLKFDDYLELIGRDDSLAGLVINPCRRKLVIEGQVLERFRRQKNKL